MASSEPSRQLVRKQLSLPEIRQISNTMGHSSRGGVPVPGGEENGNIDQSMGFPGSLRDLILSKTKGGSEAPYATRPWKPYLCGQDTAEEGGSYRSHFNMRLHRTKHVRTMNGPNERFGSAIGSPIASWEHGFAPPDLAASMLRPPKYPISQSQVTKTWSEIQKTCKHMKPR
eukprot:TRINITY_DN93499_c0_g1_i1.p1 TRINITY_DN93499_c0_g1~~TRINITY_DN93499_c0_g1_i1.p1  ORF type:complete len:172 (-),score=33.76 TRINITY_DN93499_c0_g1_i1:215-730(-)